MYVACLIIPRLALQAETARHRELAGRPLVIYDGIASRPRLRAASPVIGARPGTPLSQVLASYPDVALIAADPVHYRLCWDRVIGHLADCFPGVESTDPGHAYIDIGGLTTLYGGIGGLTSRLRAAVPGDWEVRLGMGTGKFAAYCAAEQSGANQMLPAPTSPDALRSFLADLPLSLLPLSEATQRLLEDFGLQCIGDLAAQPQAALRARFGPDGARAWELAQGRDHAPLRPLPAAPTVADRLEFPFPAVSVEAFSSGLLALLQRLYRLPAMEGRAAGRAVLIGQISDHPTWSFKHTFKELAASPAAAHSALQAGLAGLGAGPLGLPGPVEDLQVELGRLDAMPTIQAELWSQSRKTDLQVAVARLGKRLAGEALLRVIEVEPWSRIPERRQALVRFTAP